MYGNPAFSKANGPELWVLILEKAYSKLYGSYERIEAGFAEESLRDLTGAPYESVSNTDDNFWDKILEAESMNYLTVASAGTS
jgi:calpain-15